MILKNYTVEEFYNNPPNEEVYLHIIRNLEPINKIYHIEFDGFWNTSYEKYITVKKIISSQTEGWEFEAINICFNLTYPQIKNLSVYTFFSTIDYVSKNLLEILEKEKALQREPNFELLESGVEKLNKYGEVLTIDSLARSYGVSWEEIGKWKYSKIFTILMLEKERAEIQEQYMKIQERKNKRT